jgi:hypothetical protein
MRWRQSMRFDFNLTCESHESLRLVSQRCMSYGKRDQTRVRSYFRCVPARIALRGHRNRDGLILDRVGEPPFSPAIIGESGPAGTETGFAKSA